MSQLRVTELPEGCRRWVKDVVKLQKKRKAIKWERTIEDILKIKPNSYISDSIS